MELGVLYDSRFATRFCNLLNICDTSILRHCMARFTISNENVVPEIGLVVEDRGCFRKSRSVA